MVIDLTKQVVYRRNMVLYGYVTTYITYVVDAAVNFDRSQLVTAVETNTPDNKIQLDMPHQSKK